MFINVLYIFSKTQHCCLIQADSASSSSYSRVLSSDKRVEGGGKVKLTGLFEVASLIRFSSGKILLWSMLFKLNEEEKQGSNTGRKCWKMCSEV